MTTKEDISAWFDEGVKSGSLYMLVICDTFDHEDYPVYARTADECIKKYRAPGDMQRVMEVYDLKVDKAKQLSGHRTVNLPKEA